MMEKQNDNDWEKYSRKQWCQGIRAEKGWFQVKVRSCMKEKCDLSDRGDAEHEELRMYSERESPNAAHH